ncbi:tRNA (cytidine(34)-2'-O)-methyltransferase, partial [bacterium]|nr:tRNA (cytidine(34)-2'-O)-methyltransferase [bacterium]
MIEHLKKNAFEVALFEPEIPANTGNIIRLSACLGITLHLIHPLGFNFDDKHLKRAGLDYHDLVEIKHHLNFDIFLKKTAKQRIIALSTKAQKCLWEMTYTPGDVFLFGPESRGLPTFILDQLHDSLIKIPMNVGVRSLNLSNAVAITSYEAAR